VRMGRFHVPLAALLVGLRGECVAWRQWINHLRTMSPRPLVRESEGRITLNRENVSAQHRIRSADQRRCEAEKTQKLSASASPSQIIIRLPRTLPEQSIELAAAELLRLMYTVRVDEPDPRFAAHFGSEPIQTPCEPGPRPREGSATCH
jgi:hypothetical protein